MNTTIRSSLTILLLMSILTGLIYPMAITGVAELLFPFQRRGSLVTLHNRVVGSKLMGQRWNNASFFHGRPSAIGYNPRPSGGSNASIASMAYRRTFTFRRDSLARVYGTTPGALPPDLLMTSGSGLDPDISVDAAMVQVSRICTARNWDARMADRVRSLIRQHTETMTLGLMGSDRVNVLQLNIALEELNA